MSAGFGRDPELLDALGDGLEEDRRLLGGLQMSRQLPPRVTLSVLDALMLWQERGRPWSTDVPLAGGAEHGRLLREVVRRLHRTAERASGVAQLELGQVLRVLDRAVLALDDAERAQSVREREALLRNPDLASLLEP